MKIFSFFTAIVLMTAMQNCSTKKAAALPSSCYKGKLAVKANCMNYTISVVQGNIDGALVEASWKDETTGKTYSNAFALDSRCTFPATINEGDEFYFVIDSTARQECAVCMMYYPVPAKRLAIRIIQEPCAQ